MKNKHPRPVAVTSTREQFVYVINGRKTLVMEVCMVSAAFSLFQEVVYEADMGQFEFDEKAFYYNHGLKRLIEVIKMETKLSVTSIGEMDGDEIIFRTMLGVFAEEARMRDLDLFIFNSTEGGYQLEEDGITKKFEELLSFTENSRRTKDFIVFPEYEGVKGPVSFKVRVIDDREISASEHKTKIPTMVDDFSGKKTPKYLQRWAIENGRLIRYVALSIWDEESSIYLNEALDTIDESVVSRGECIEGLIGLAVITKESKAKLSETE